LFIGILLPGALVFAAVPAVLVVVLSDALQSFELHHACGSEYRREDQDLGLNKNSASYCLLPSYGMNRSSGQCTSMLVAAVLPESADAHFDVRHFYRQARELTAR
jgi:hypothetical protein